jgi:3-oxoacyl-[acyl-carrier protein] reductase
MMSVEISLSGKIALVTGASRKIGIGTAICRLLAQAGADIFFTYYRPYDGEMAWGSHPEEPGQLLDELRTLGVRAEAVEADLSDPNTPRRLFDQAEAALGPVDILVNNATYDVEEDIYAITAESLDRHYAVNIRGATLLCAEFARRHNGRPGGRIISMVSGELVSPMKGNLPYVITKGGVDALTISLSGELAVKGITINAVDPGATDTGWMSPELYETLRQQTALGRVGKPEDAANLILFLASPLGGWITGQILHSRGGL